MVDLEERIRSLAEPVLARHGAELVDLQVKAGRTRLVRVVADKPGGIDLDTCAVVSTELGRLLDAEDPIEGTYTLEVTSPGLDRPLRTPEDFRKHVGRSVKIVMAHGQADGIVEEVGDESVTLGRDGERTQVHYADIARATLVLPW